ncbi:hypothetical protein B0H34DRAFT_803153 [Crassisporium funariophilum]|nr:hypothetical protein B0H34DRAFT_803153 [Crassisporium funariophilum]
MAECLGTNKDEIWEVVNPALDRLLGFGRSFEDVQSLVCRGEKGVAGFREYLTYLVEEGGVAGALLEGKVETLLSAMKNMSSHKDSQPPAQQEPKGMATNPVDVDLLCPLNMQQSSALVTLGGLSAMPLTQLCCRIPLVLPVGVSPYSAYPYKLHDTLSLPWDIHIQNHQMRLQSTHCKGMAGKDACRPCRKLFFSVILEGIRDQIERGVHENTPLVYQPIEGLIALVRRKNESLDTLQFIKLTMARKIVV